jgi:hypothetical protein
MLKKEAYLIVGGLSKPSKMPGMSIGLPAKECKTGGKLRDIEGSVCNKCYALKGCYVQYPAVQLAQYRRLEALTDPKWIDAMIALVKDQSVFRWHDSGDIQNFQHLLNIVGVCEETPDCSHWLPTKESKFVKRYLREYGSFPNNLTVRVSSAMVGGRPVNSLNTSTVHTDSPIGFECVAPSQGGKCLDCRACWDKSVSNISYKQH